MTTQLLNGEFVFNTGSAKFCIGAGKWHWQLFNEDGVKMNTTTTDSITIVMAKQLLDEATVNMNHPFPEGREANPANRIEVDRQKLLDSNRELLEALEEYLYISGYGYQDSDSFKKAKTAINNAKNLTI